MAWRLPAAGMWTSRRAKLFLLIQEETLIVLVEQKDDRNGTPLGKRASLWKKAVGASPLLCLLILRS